MFNTIISIIMLVFMGFIIYMQVHMTAEQRRGKYIRLPWERKQDRGNKNEL